VSHPEVLDILKLERIAVFTVSQRYEALAHSQDSNFDIMFMTQTGGGGLALVFVIFSGDAGISLFTRNKKYFCSALE
jgi:hypothetical protein